jgi:hypothetical protein
MTTIYELFGTGKPLAYKQEMLLGIEVELEHVNNLPEEGLKHWQVTNDESLRNNGKEFVSKILNYSRPHYKQALAELQEQIDKFNYQASFRCGIHVHVNVGHLTSEDLWNLYVTYLAYENLLFQYVANNRNQSIFCVPVQSTEFPVKLRNKRDAKGIVDARYLNQYTTKYSALNLLPLTQHGTVEFRHLHGTNNLKQVEDWINIIHNLYLLSMQPNILPELCAVNTTSEYGLWVRKVFENPIEQLNTDEEHQAKLLRTGVRFVKQVS